MDPTIISAVILCLIMALHADARFNTPLRDRSTTRRWLYQRARLSYICVTVSVLFILGWTLGFWKVLDFCKVPNNKLSPENPLLAWLVALVFLTEGIPHLPFLSKIDQTFLESFKSAANIPKEVQHWADQLKPESLQVEADDLPKLSAFIEDENALRDELGDHLCILRPGQAETSEYRFTRILKLYKALTERASLSKYERFFRDYAEDWKQAQQNFENFCLRSVESLELAVKYEEEKALAAHKELLDHIRENFRLRCREHFSQLAQLLAGAFVSSEPDEEQFFAALRQVGFTGSYVRTPEFPVDELCHLSIILFVFVFTIHALIRPLLTCLHIAQAEPAQNPSVHVIWPLLTLLSYITALAVTIKWLLAHPRLPKKPIRPWSKYLACAALAGGAVALLFGGFVVFLHLSGNGPYHWELVPRVSLAIAAMCLVVAFLCEKDEGDNREGFLRRCGEALAVAGSMLLAELLLDFYLPIPHEKWPNAGVAIFTLVIPSALAAIAGFWVPHMYRMSCRIEQPRQTEEAKGVERHELKVVSARPKSPDEAAESRGKKSLKRSA